MTRAAADLGSSRQSLHAILAEKAAVTPEMALRLGKFCGNGPDPWINMQVAYDLWHARERLGDRVAAIPTHRAA